MDLLITICARGGSKGIPGKNIRPVNGIPLIAYTIHHAQEYAKQWGGDIALSTEDPKIRAVAEIYGLKTDYIRPAPLASDTAGKVDTLKDLLLHHERARGKRYDMLMDLDVTSPLRTMDDLRATLDLIQANPKALNIFSVSFPRHNPYTDMVERTAEGFYYLSKPTETTYLSRQTAPKVYEMNASFYYYRRAFFDTDITGHVTKQSLIYEVPHMCFELDEMAEYELLEYLLSHRKLDFPLLVPAPRPS
ncbi:MAG: acylneuraminate cytidylyltransferase family protein [Candidatus Peribacteraceae bacterium]|nr:acylneuraminate cytidylyltransferase family protein [Candidatus Peribacteraceae bacterium]MDD5741919.1 acylneuraminate cytidylyltransferase family protein [Candidatus Peribacteraceae bacterium]